MVQYQSIFLVTVLIIKVLNTTHGAIGTAAPYPAPYTPTACNGNDPTQFPTSNLFAAAGDGIWDDGAACGRQYYVRCISATVQGGCNTVPTIQIDILDQITTAPSHPSVNGTTMALSKTAFEAIADPSMVDFINIEFQQV